ncbi:hypothetical protein JG687_00005218 [Phytophthora cactorum]|uniref:Uncharacterized protein n=1 Tax=Phytophthora cactorum TaxID=29920 RepID=A0A8T1ULH9_9STRA|nr:hypothetical protein JG687_00005218 [Phytophthora cactorum]
MTFIRTSSAADDTDEERAPIIDKIKALFKYSKVTPEMLYNWLKEGQSAEMVFKPSPLNARKDPAVFFHLLDLNWVERIFTTPEFSVWATYVNDVNARHPGEPISMILTLTKHLGR